MGVTGLLGLLKSIQTPCHLKSYAGKTIGVDAYGWLHRGLISCSVALALDKPTRKYVDFALNRVRMLIHFGVIPYIVLDGNYLPSKGMTETSRAARRENSRKVGLELLRQGRSAQAQQELQKAADLTPEMAKLFIEELKKMNVQYVVAPYEADSQLVYLEKQGLIHGIISEDSDLLVFGAKVLFTKLDQYGAAISISREQLGTVKDINLVGWTDADFRTMAIMSGCDYIKNIPGLGLKKAHGLIRKYRTIDRIVKVLQLEGNFRVPPDYLASFREAEQAFLYQWVFCPIEQKMVNLSDPSLEPELDISSLLHIGSFIEDSIAQSVALGDLDPHTKLPLSVPVAFLDENSAPPPAPWKPVPRNMSLAAFEVDQRQISAFFRPVGSQVSTSGTLSGLESTSVGSSSSSSLHRSQSEVVTTSTVPFTPTRRVHSAVSAAVGSSSSFTTTPSRPSSHHQNSDGQTAKRPRLSLTEQCVSGSSVKMEVSKFFSTPAKSTVGRGSAKISVGRTDSPVSENPNTLKPTSLSAPSPGVSNPLSRFAMGGETDGPSPQATTKDQDGEVRGKSFISRLSTTTPSSDKSRLAAAVQADISFLRTSISAPSSKRTGSLGDSPDTLGASRASPSLNLQTVQKNSQQGTLDSHFDKFKFSYATTPPPTTKEERQCKATTTPLLPVKDGNHASRNERSTTPFPQELVHDGCKDNLISHHFDETTALYSPEKPDRVLVPASDDFPCPDDDNSATVNSSFSFSSFPSAASFTFSTRQPTSTTQSFTSSAGSTYSAPSLRFPSTITSSRLSTTSNRPHDQARLSSLSPVNKDDNNNRPAISTLASVGSEDLLTVPDSEDDNDDGKSACDDEEGDYDDSVITPASSLLSSFVFSASPSSGRTQVQVSSNISARTSQKLLSKRSYGVRN